MWTLIHKARNTVSTMVERVYSILQDKGKATSAIQLQIVGYRNWDSELANLVHASTWATKADELKSFMESIRAMEGDGNEAIEAALAYVNQEHDRLLAIGDRGIQRVILIGDSPPNGSDPSMPNEVVRKRAYWGELFWKDTRFDDPSINYFTECERLQERCIPVIALWVKTFWAQGLWGNTKTEEAFSEIARMTNGTCEQLDIGKESGAQRLTDLVSTAILSQFGSDFVEAYKIKYGYCEAHESK